MLSELLELSIEPWYSRSVFETTEPHHQRTLPRAIGESSTDLRFRRARDSIPALANTRTPAFGASGRWHILSSGCCVRFTVE
jgi:hypothetical protein